MRHSFSIPAVMICALAVAGCANKDKDAVERAFQDVNVIDATNLNDVMLTSANPDEAVVHFLRVSKKHPERADLQRGLAISLSRAKRNTEAVAASSKLTKMKGANMNDRVNLADALVRNGEWDRARKTLDSIPPTHETFSRYRLEAIVADSRKDWKRADSFYETAVGLTTRPAGVLNNWGYSKLTRGDFAAAEKLFNDAIRQDRSLYTAKNNLVLARSAQGNYSMPVIPMTQVERAQLLNTMAISAVKQGDVTTGKVLLRDAIATHPQYFEEAVRSLAALEET